MLRTPIVLVPESFTERVERDLRCERLFGDMYLLQLLQDPSVVIAGRRRCSEKAHEKRNVHR
jgi:hypothetical protein